MEKLTYQTITMKHLIALLLLTIPLITFSQKMQLNIGGGLINYGGDLQDKNFTFDQANAALNVGLSCQILKQLFVTAGYTSGKISASDANTKNYSRNLNFKSKINEASLVLEFDFRDITGKRKFTPYISGGVAVFHFNPYTFDSNGTRFFLKPLSTEGEGLAQYPESKEYPLTQLSIPFGFGFKYAVSDRLAISTEISFRKLFTDHLDDVSKKNYADTEIIRQVKGDVAARLSFRGDEIMPPVDFSPTLIRGNPNRKDSYYTCLLKLCFTISKDDGLQNNSSKKTRRQSKCPPKVL